jgi:hypothetical protein
MMQLYQHYKGGLYVVTDVAVKDSTNRQPRGQNFVLYYSLEMQAHYVRNYEEFHENVEHEGRTGPRFRFIADPSDIMLDGGLP